MSCNGCCEKYSAAIYRACVCHSLLFDIITYASYLTLSAVVTSCIQYRRILINVDVCSLLFSSHYALFVSQKKNNSGLDGLNVYVFFVSLSNIHQLKSLFSLIIETLSSSTFLAIIIVIVLLLLFFIFITVVNITVNINSVFVIFLFYFCSSCFEFRITGYGPLTDGFLCNP